MIAIPSAETAVSNMLLVHLWEMKWVRLLDQMQDHLLALVSEELLELLLVSCFAPETLL